MATLLQRGFGLLNRGMEAAAAEFVVYKRGAVVVSEALTATLSNQQIEQLSAGGATVVGREFTWRLKRDELVVQSQQVSPAKFDRIEWTYSGKTFVFVVMPELGGPESPAVDPRSDFIPAAAKLDSVT